MRLKKRSKKKDEQRDPSVCGASRCKVKPEFNETTGALDTVDVPLCAKHWQAHLDENPPDPKEVAAIEAAGREAMAKKSLEGDGEAKPKAKPWIFEETDSGLRLAE